MTTAITQNVAFGGELLSVGPDYNYNPGDEVYIHIQSHIEADGLPWYGVWWYSYFRVYDVDTEELLADNWNIHWSLPWNTYDEADEDFYQPIGQMPTRALNLQVELYGNEGGTVVQTPLVLCDYKQCSVLLADGESPPPPPQEGEFPWKWVAIGSGALVLVALLVKMR